MVAFYFFKKRKNLIFKDINSKEVKLSMKLKWLNDHRGMEVGQFNDCVARMKSIDPKEEEEFKNKKEELVISNKFIDFLIERDRVN